MKLTKPDAIVDFPDACGLTCQRLAEVDFLAIKRESIAGSTCSGQKCNRKVAGTI
jgi:hypothetical protein